MIEVPEYSSIGLVTLRRNGAEWRARIDLDKIMFLDPMPEGVDATLAAELIAERFQISSADVSL